MRGRQRWLRRSVPGLVVIVLGSLLAGCTGEEKPDNTASAPSPSPSASSSGPVTLTFGVYGDAARVATYRRLADAFTAKHPEVTIKLESAPDATSSQADLEQHFAQGDAPDVFLTDHDQLPTLVSEGRVQPVDELLEKRGVPFGDSFERLGLESMAADSALQCMPNDVSPYVVFYNRQLFPPNALQPTDAPSTATPPPPEAGWTWQQFATAAQQMSHDGVRGVYLPPRLTTLIPLVRSAGGDLMDDPRNPTTLTFSDDANRDSLETILQLARDPSVTPSAAMLARSDALTRFEHGRIGMLVGTRALVPRLRQQTGLRFDVLPLPKLTSSKTIADVTGYCINKSSPHVDTAADFIAFASRDEGAAITAESGGIVPANLAVLHSDSFNQPGQYPVDSQVFSTVLTKADPLPFSAAWPDVVAQTQPQLDRLFYAPVVDLDVLLPRIDALSASLLAAPSASASPSP